MVLVLSIKPPRTLAYKHALFMTIPSRSWANGQVESEPAATLTVNERTVGMSDNGQLVPIAEMGLVRELSFEGSHLQHYCCSINGILDLQS